MEFECILLVLLMSLQGGFAHDQGAGWMDVLFIEEPPRHEIGLDSSVVYATKSVDFEGSTLTLRSGFVPVGFQPKPRKSQGMYALMSWILDLVCGPTIMHLHIYVSTVQ